MKELNSYQVQEVNGGIAALVWVGYGAYRAYKAYRLVRVAAGAGAGGFALGVAGE
ncbi:hypothetical protein [Pseudoalteromonas piscicida]|uniref:hypothetical protein n=1 Tax=Pseudoalteromonas piscicida TaxID=43662 RepID=UPI0012FE591D|nr:hypothetical protein [Pseudoalteromonas piscicida]